MAKTYAVEITRQDRDMLLKLLRGYQEDHEKILEDARTTKFCTFYIDRVKRIKALKKTLNDMEVKK